MHRNLFQTRSPVRYHSHAGENPHNYRHSERNPTSETPRHSRVGGNPEGKGGKNHGNHPPIMAIMVQTLHAIPNETPCHSERSEESSPSHSVRGLGRCTRLISRHSRVGGNPEGKGGKNHGNHPPIMAIMVQTLHAIPNETPCHSERSEEHPPSQTVRGQGDAHA